MAKDKNKIESLYIKNFLSIEEAIFDIKDFSIIIGPQAVGKSIILKLVYFFKHFRDYLIDCSISSDQEKINSFIIQKFEEIFKISQNNNQAEIVYNYNDIEIKILIEDHITIVFNNKLKNIVDSLNKICTEYNTKKDEKELIVEKNGYESSLLGKMHKELDKYIDSNLILFIPAGRSFFSIINQNIWRTTKDKILKIDETMQDFGVNYERLKDYWNSWAINHSIANDVLHSKFMIKDNEIYIKSNDNREVEIATASSGEQEFFPLAIFMDILLNANITSKEVVLLIEEPEAHLFPTAQKEVVYNIVKTMNQVRKSNNIKCLITTHSPYVMTSFNNLILAGMVPQNNRSKVNEIIGDLDFIIDRGINAFYLDKKLISIMDGNLIDAQRLDEISDTLMEEFDALLDLCNDE